MHEGPLAQWITHLIMEMDLCLFSEVKIPEIEGRTLKAIINTHKEKRMGRFDIQSKEKEAM
jgi:hypothetical protein